MIAGVDVVLEPRDGLERKVQVETLPDGSVHVSLMMQGVSGAWYEADSMTALPGDESSPREER